MRQKGKTLNDAPAGDAIVGEVVGHLLGEPPAIDGIINAEAGINRMPDTPLAKTVEQDIERLVEGEEIVVREKVLRGVLHALLELALDG